MGFPHNKDHRWLYPGSVNGATVNLSLGAIGCAILTMPSAFEDSGTCWALGMLAFIAVMTVFSIRFLGIAIETLQAYSYQAISREVIGPTAVLLADWMLFLFNFGDLVGYVIVGGQLLEPVEDILFGVDPAATLSNPQYISPKRFTFVFWLLLLLPLTFVRRITWLEKGSACAVFVYIVLALAIAYRYFFPLHPSDVLPMVSYHLKNTATAHIRHASQNTDDIVGLSPSPLMLRNEKPPANLAQSSLTIALLMFAFDCQSLIFHVYASLDDRSPRTITRVAARSTMLVACVFACVGVFGSKTFGSTVPDNILRAYDPVRDPVFGVVYVLILLPVAQSFALVLFPVRDVVIHTLYGIDAGCTEKDELPYPTFCTISATISASCCVVALVAPQLNVVFGLLGGLCSAALCYVYPGLFYLSLLRLGMVEWSTVGCALSLGMVIFGGVAGLVGTWASILEWVQAW